MQKSDDIRSLQLTLGVYVLIFGMKLAAYVMSGVMALLAESLHTLSDIFIAGFLLVATLYSRKPADNTHMFGYGRTQNVAALVAATLFISFTSFELYKEAIPRLFRTEVTTYLATRQFEFDRGERHGERLTVLQTAFDPAQPNLENTQVTPFVPIDTVAKATLDHPHRSRDQPRI